MYSNFLLLQFGFFGVSLSSQLPSSGWKAANFQKTCGSWYIMGPSANSIAAVCNSTISAPVWSSLDLGQCLWNDGGQLKPGNGGDFDESCSSCSLDRSAESPTKYECLCQKAGSPAMASPIDLGQVVGNWDGQLCCGEGDYICGKTSQSPPM
ncbi:Putative cyanovirin-N [Colletotrichum destructivum]|uniref:Cyanovirin-N n=1 Tax=Colletotrichum destructivum TaxID=34406 RepID=A0AAX4I193_9PEZI|nr:Putative cyanovirin-N [Colletotrichum destructivum]